MVLAAVEPALPARARADAGSAQAVRGRAGAGEGERLMPDRNVDVDKHKLHPYQQRNIAQQRHGHVYDQHDGAAVRGQPVAERPDPKDSTLTRSLGFALDGKLVRAAWRVLTSGASTLVCYYVDIFRDRRPK